MSAALAHGFGDPVIEAQQVFRAAMDALARPGRVHRLDTALAPPAPLTPELAAVALALADHEAPLWLDDALRAVPAVATFLRFHTGAALVTDPQEAAFALIADSPRMPALDRFALGDPAYPDRSTTLVIAVESLREGDGPAFEGPGIKGRTRLGAAPLPADWPARLQANHALFPRGIDALLVAPGRIAGLPRSTAILPEA